MEIDYRQLRESFTQTSLDMLQRCESDLIAAESAGAWPDLTEYLRALHTIKGNAGIFDLADIIALCHAMETTLAETSAGMPMSSDDIDRQLTAIDLMRGIISTSDEKQGIATAEKVKKTLRSLGDNKAETANERDTRPARGENFAPDIRLPKKYYDYAKQNNKQLHLVILDLGEQGSLTLKDLHATLAGLHKRKELLSFGDITPRLWKKFPDISAYYLVVALDGAAADFFRSEKINVLYSRNLTAVNPTTTTTPVAASEGRADTHLRVRSELLTALIDLTGEIVLARNTLLRRIGAVGERGLDSAGKKVGQLVSDLQDLVMRTRLQPIKSLLQRLPRLVRETALTTGKKAELNVDDGGIEIDKVIFDQIDESLTHLIRNAIDHGIENPGERKRKGKSAAGLIDLKVSMQAGSILIHIRDDGQGLDFDAIRSKAIGKKLITAEEAAVLDKSGIAKLIFLPGFSTRDNVSEISGRGVGMDVVRGCVARVGGTVEINYETESGTEFILRIPQTLSILTCLIIEIGARRFAVPRQQVAEIIRYDEYKLRHGGAANTMVMLRDELITVIDTAELLGFKTSKPTHHLILKTERHRFALTADEILDTEEVVVKPVPVKQLKAQSFSGAAVMGDGQIALILDLHAIAAGRIAETKRNPLRLESPALPQATLTLQRSYLLIEVGARQVLLTTESKPRIEKVSATQLSLAGASATLIYNGAVVDVAPWREIAGYELADVVDAEKADPHAVIFTFGSKRFALIASRLVDIVPVLNAPVTPRPGNGPVSGETVIRSKPALIVEPQRLVAGEIYAKAG